MFLAKQENKPVSASQSLDTLAGHFYVSNDCTKLSDF